MSDLFTLIGYEYKKIGKRKSTYITLGITLFLILFAGLGVLVGYTYVDGVKANTKYDEMKIDRDYALKLTGRTVDKALIEEMQKGYSHVDITTRYTTTKEYQLYARPYDSISNIIWQVTDDINIDANSFYEIRNEKLRDNLLDLNMNDGEIDKHLELNKKVITPFTYSYSKGYQRFTALNFTTGIFLIFGLAICIAPIFAGEYTNKMDHILLSSKYGKNKLILAKLITGISFTVMIALLFLGISLLEFLLIYGYEGSNAPLQIWSVLSSYPLLIKDVVQILIVCTTLASVWVISITMFLSAKFKSPFSVIIVTTVIIFGGMFINVSSENRFLMDLWKLLPTNMMSYLGVFSDYTFQIGGMNILPYHFIPIFCIVATMIFLYFAYHGFKNHQIS